jgi:tRNA threonylcarbamoyladenosine biosynthesis protein TsaB
MNEVYWACFERGGDGLAQLEGEERVSKPSEVKLPAGWSTATPVGRGFIAYADALRAAVPTAVVAAADIAAVPTAESLVHLLPHATDIALLAAPDVTAGRLIPPEAATPIYLRDNVAHVAQPAKPPSHAP